MALPSMSMVVLMQLVLYSVLMKCSATKAAPQIRGLSPLKKIRTLPRAPFKSQNSSFQVLCDRLGPQPSHMKNRGSASAYRLPKFCLEKPYRKCAV